MIHHLFHVFRGAMTAAAFAEAGEHETARTLLEIPAPAMRGRSRLTRLDKAHAD